MKTMLIIDTRQFLLAILTLIAVNNLIFPTYLFNGPIRQIVIFSLCALIICYTLFFNSISIDHLRNNYVPLVFMISILIMIFLGLSITPSFSYGLSKFLRFLLYSFLPSLCFFLLGPYRDKDKKIILLLILFSAFFVSLTFFFNSIDYAGMNGRFSISQKIHPNNLSRNICIGISICFSLFFSKRYSLPIRLILIVIASFLLLSSLQTGSRGPIVAAIFSLFFTIFSVFTIKNSIRIIFLFFFIILSITFIGEKLNIKTIAGSQILRMYSLTSRIGQNSSDQQRLLRYEKAADVFMASNGLGVGTGGFMHHWIGPPPGGIEKKKEYPHNLFLEFLAEYGIIGFLLIVSYILFLNMNYYKVNILNYSVMNNGFFCLWIYTFINSQISGDIASNYQFWVMSSLCFNIFNSSNDFIGNRKNEKWN